MARGRRTLSVLSTLVSITLVLFLFGLLGVFMLNAQKVSVILKEDIELNVFFREEVKEADVQFLYNKISTENYLKSAELKTREQARDEVTKSIGDDFVEIIGYNPLPYTIDFHVNHAYANPDSLSKIAAAILKNNWVRDVYYQPDIVKNVDHNIRLVGMSLAGAAFIFLLVAIALINSTIRLAMYSRRFIIKSMQLVGATRNFIRKPFVWQSIFSGLLSGLLADGMLLLLLIYVGQNYPELILVKDVFSVLTLFITILLLGLLISAFSSFFAINRYLNLKLDELY